ncbi:MAG: LptF/LptG family permease, partial [Pseudomonadota bacterium]
WLEPYSRYGYRALKHAATHGAWTGNIEAQTFFTPSDELTIYAGQVDLDGRDLADVFVRQIDEAGREVVTTAATGRVDLIPESGMAQVTLQDVVQVTQDPGRGPVTMRLRNFSIDPTFPMEPRPYRPRGDDGRELTLVDLLLDRPAPGATALPGTAVERQAELHGRITSALSILLMPFLAIPMGMAAKRQRRGVTIAIAAIVLILYQNLLEMGGGLVAAGTLTPLLGQWLPFCVFAALSIWLCLRLDSAPRGPGLDVLFDPIERAISAVTRRPRRNGRGAASS